MYLFVTRFEHYDGIARRIYRLNDGGTVEEFRYMPEVARWEFWDSRNHRVYKKSDQAAMKKAVERYKKRGKFI